MSAAEWMVQAEDDLKAADVLEKAGHHSQAIWLSGQAVEKAQKSLLFALGLRLSDDDLKRYGHNLSRISNLVPDALHQPPDPSIASDLGALEKHVANCRYPAPGASAPAVTTLASARDVAVARRLVDWCKERSKRAAAGVAAMLPARSP